MNDLGCLSKLEVKELLENIGTSKPMRLFPFLMKFPSKRIGFFLVNLQVMEQYDSGIRPVRPHFVTQCLIHFQSICLLLLVLFFNDKIIKMQLLGLRPFI